MKPNRFQITNRKQIHKQLVAIIREKVQTVVAQLERHDTQANNDQLTHDARTLIKELRAIWRLLRPTITESTYQRNNRRLRDAAHKLSISRDVFVAEATVKQLIAEQTDQDLSPLIEALTGIIKQEVKSAPPASQLSAAMTEIAQALHQTIDEFHRLSLPESGWSMIELGLKATYRQARRRLRQTRQHNRARDFHDWRKSTKALWYQLRLLQPYWPAKFKRLSKKLKRLEQQLGDEHDLTMLCQRLNADPSLFGGQKSVESVINALNEKREKLRDKAIKLGQTAFRRKPKRLIKS